MDAEVALAGETVGQALGGVAEAGGQVASDLPSADAEAATPPDRAADAVVLEKIDEHQALLYRLSGDWNPLHVDPGFAGAFGFEKPILHGLCTFGYVGRHVIANFCGGDARLFKKIKVRFADSVFPGETLKTEMWKEGDRVLIRASVVERDKPVLTAAVVELHREVPKDEPLTAAAAPAVAVALKVTGLAVTPLATTRAVRRLAPTAGPSVHAPTVAMPLGLVTAPAPVTEPPPPDTLKNTEVALTGVLKRSRTITDGAVATAVLAAALWLSPP
jgi:acyl dehydratase